PHEPRLSVHRRHDGTVPTRPPSPVPRGLNTISPGHLDSVYLPQPRRRDRPRSSRRTEPPADSAGGQGAVQRPDERRIGGWHHHADPGPALQPNPDHPVAATSHPLALLEHGPRRRHEPPHPAPPGASGPGPPPPSRPA